jgi:hypothetical protein
MALSSSSSVSTEETWEPLMEPKLIGGKRRRFSQFLRVYMNCFAFSMKELGASIGPGIRIELASDTLIFRRPYRSNIRFRIKSFSKVGFCPLLYR